MKRAEVLAISLLATFTGLTGGALAQSAQSSRPDKTAEKTAPQYADSAPESDDDSSVRSPVLKVTGVEVMRSAHGPALDVVHVWGVSSTDAWDTPEIVPLTHTPSGDGVLELLFVARSPSEAMDPTPFGTLEAVFIIAPGHPYKGIRVRGASNSLLLGKMPGYVEAAAPSRTAPAASASTSWPRVRPRRRARAEATSSRRKTWAPTCASSRHRTASPSSTWIPTGSRSWSGTMARSSWRSGTSILRCAIHPGERYPGDHQRNEKDDARARVQRDRLPKGGKLIPFHEASADAVRWGALRAASGAYTRIRIARCLNQDQDFVATRSKIRGKIRSDIGQRLGLQRVKPLAVLPSGYTRIGAHADSKILAATAIAARARRCMRAATFINGVVSRTVASLPHCSRHSTSSDGAHAGEVADILATIIGAVEGETTG